MFFPRFRFAPYAEAVRDMVLDRVPLAGQHRFFSFDIDLYTADPVSHPCALV